MKKERVITLHNTRENYMDTEAAISQEQVMNNQAVRNTLIDRGIRPEFLHPVEDIKKLERRIASQEKKALKSPDILDSNNE